MLLNKEERKDNDHLPQRTKETKSCAVVDSIELWLIHKRIKAHTKKY
jgi:hypothetical protein